MTECELCGRDMPLKKASIEGTVLAVCFSCSETGSEVREFRPVKKLPEFKENLQVLAADYAERIKKAREKKKWTHKDIAQILHEKESTIKRAEDGKFRPAIELAGKLERLLGIILVEKMEIKEIKKEAETASGLTLGDLLKDKLKYQS